MPKAPYLGSQDIRNSCLQMVFKFAKSKPPTIWAIIQEKASQYVKELSIENFKDSDGWLRRWKERNVTFKTISGESNSVTPEMVNAWSETSLPTLLYNCDLKDIYNADKFQTKHTNSSQKGAQVES